MPSVEATRPSFVPDWTFKGAALDGWRALGQPSGGPSMVSSAARRARQAAGSCSTSRMQDLQFGFDVQCRRVPQGVLLRAEKTADGGMKGVFAACRARSDGFA